MTQEQPVTQELHPCWTCRDTEFVEISHSSQKDGWPLYRCVNCKAIYPLAALSLSTPATEDAVERAWLIEQNGGGFVHWVALAENNWPRYKQRRGRRLGELLELDAYLTPVRFVKDANEALRFARKEDAEAVIKLFDRFLLHPVATEHEWPSALPPSPALDGGEADPLCDHCGNPLSIHGDYVCLDKRDEAEARRAK